MLTCKKLAMITTPALLPKQRLQRLLPLQMEPKLRLKVSSMLLLKLYRPAIHRVTPAQKKLQLLKRQMLI
jgi:hypothetical protein